MRLLNNAWNSVSEVAIKCCFKKVNFTQPEESIKEQETEDTNNREIVKIWERLQAGGLIPKRYGFTNHSTSDKGLITHETITESSILSKLTVDEEEEEKEGDEDDKEISIEEVLPAVPSPIDALAPIRKLDHYNMY